MIQSSIILESKADREREQVQLIEQQQQEAGSFLKKASSMNVRILQGLSFFPSSFFASKGPLSYGSNKNDPPPVHIGIVGGGIAGISAAHALAKRLHQDKQVLAKIVVFEADEAAEARFRSEGPPLWTAATARNANSIVPGAAMHIMSQRSVLRQIARDTVVDFWAHKWDAFRNRIFLRNNHEHGSPQLCSIDNFQVVPPYFAFHVLQCLGPHVNNYERRSFLIFFRYFLKTCLQTGPREADERAKFIVQLAKANRHAFLEDVQSLMRRHDFGVSRGFLSLHRSLELANKAVDEVRQFGETAELISWEQAVEMEPLLGNIPFEPIYAIHRPSDVTANCLLYTQFLKKRCQESWGVEIKEGVEGNVLSIERIWNKNGNQETVAAQGRNGQFYLRTADGNTHTMDYLVLAAGVRTPLLAQQLSAAQWCPTYPLRGYSLTLHVNQDGLGVGESRHSTHATQSNLLSRPFSIDQMYCSSVTPQMVRLAGFGELVGYPEFAGHVHSVGPRVLARYGQSIFFPSKLQQQPGQDDRHHAVQCFRPMSPDDLPLVGRVGSEPGLYLHHGHGTLGWTMCLATGDCVAQAVEDDLHGRSPAATFVLPDQTEMSRHILSPNRFVSKGSR